MPDETPVPDEATQDRPRRRPLLLAMLAAAAILVALAGSGAFAGGGGSGAASDGSTPVQGKPATGDSGSGMTHRGRGCKHDRDRTSPQSDPSNPPV